MMDQSTNLILIDIAQFLKLITICIVIQTLFTVLRWLSYAKNSFSAKKDEAFENEMSALFKKARYNDLLEFCEKQLIKSPNSSRYLWWKARGLRELKKYDEALPVFRRVLELSPSWKDSVEPYYKDGQIVPVTE